jgi:hypothetical protein
MSIRLFVSIAALIVPLSTGAWASDYCHVSTPVNKSLVIHALEPAPVIGFIGNSRLSPFLVGHVRNGAIGKGASYGTVIFKKSGARWSAFFPYEGNISLREYVASDGRVAIFTQDRTEGIEPAWTLYYSTPNSPARCTYIGYPRGVDPDDADLNLRDFNIDGAGVGQITAYVNKGTGQRLWYQYDTVDSGKTWSKPKLLQRRPSPLSGRFRPLSQNHQSALLWNLREFVSE